MFVINTKRPIIICKTCVWPDDIDYLIKYINNSAHSLFDLAVYSGLPGSAAVDYSNTGFTDFNLIRSILL